MTERATITLVDQPDVRNVPEDERQFIHESQRTYRVADDTASHTVRVRRDPDNYRKYLVENLVSGRWHRLLEGDNDIPDGRDVPFAYAVKRAVAVLL